MAINESVRNIILETYQNDLSEEETRIVMDKILALGEWEEVRNGLINILYENDQALWNQVVIYLYYFQGRGYKYERAKTIAILYDCLILCDDLSDNLIWTITMDIQSVPYLSEYEPFHDPEVVEEMNKIKKIRNSG